MPRSEVAGEAAPGLDALLAAAALLVATAILGRFFCGWLCPLGTCIDIFDHIFLRKLKEGGTAHSFGIHVARMAGMPKEVIQSAENTLKALEMNDSQHIVSARKGEIKKPVQTKAGTLESDGSLQLSFFQLDDPTLESLRDKLAGADLNNITPLQAFDLLRSMKDELGL